MAKIDPAHDETDKLIKKYERRAKKEYKQAQKELEEKVNDYFRRYKVKYDIKAKQVADGTLSKSDFEKWVKGQILIGERWQEMQQTIAEDLLKANAKARSMALGYQAEAYALNHNYATFLVEKDSLIDTSYTLYDRRTVERLMKNEQVLPKPGKLVKEEIARGEAIRWQKGQIQSVVLQGILQGESIPHLTKRLSDNLSTRNYAAAVRYARTAITGAENAGRLDALNRATSLGIETKKQWLATPDDRTRDSHREVDGEIVGVDEKFSNGLEYPGDPNGAPEEVWNCRCTMLPALDMMDNDISDLSERFSRLDDSNADYFGWKTAHLDDEKSAEAKIKYWGNLQSGIKVKSYDGIWRQTVKTDEYEMYKDRIQGKRDYYNQQLANLDPSDPKAVQYKKYLKDLDEFERQGKLYSRYGAEKKTAEVSLRDIRRANADPNDMFSEARKDAAIWFQRGHDQHMAAHSYYAKGAAEAYAKATRQEKDGFYTYTAGSGGHNRPLAGYEKPWSQSGSGWEERFYKGPGKVWIDFEGKGDQIRGLTTLCEKSIYPDDVWLQSGQDFQTLEGTLGIARGTLQRMSEDELKQKLVGTEFELDQFISTAIHKGGGGCFNSKPTKWNLYAPSGTQMFYASDYGAFGLSEAEMILQRGGTYKIKDVYWGIDESDHGSRKLFFDMEIHPEKGYNTFQQDPKEWKGSKKNYHD